MKSTRFPSSLKRHQSTHTTSTTACGHARCKTQYAPSQDPTHTHIVFENTNTNTYQQCFSILFTGYLGGYASPSVSSADIQKAGGRLLTIEEVGTLLHVPVNLKDRDEFHLTIEEYLQAMISLIDELARLARNTVTIGDYERAAAIAIFIKNIHAGFQILNLKNDSLRKRSDGIKYRVKEVEDVVYDLSLRGLVNKTSS